MATSSILSKLAILISANNAEFLRKIQETDKKLLGFTQGVTKMAGALGVAFSVQQVASFAVEVSRLAGEAEAVRAAFERLPQSTKLMQELKDATGGTVSELALMKRAVQASNFDISLAALPKLLEFATLRAQQTGQSVDYLVDSIVTGIGRKSKLILDNLGISAVQLNEALGDTAIGAASIGQVADAVGKIIDKNLENMNSFMDNNSTKLQRLAASWENYKIAVGDAANDTGLLGNSLDAITGTLNVLSTKDLTFFEKLRAFLAGPGGAADAATEAFSRELERINREQKSAAHVIKQVDEAFVKFKGNIDEFAKAISPTHPLRGKFLEEFKKRMIEASQVEVTTLETLRNKEKELVAQFAETDIADKAKLQNIAALIGATREQIKAIEDLLKVEKESAAFSLSQTAQRALAGSPVTGVTSLSGIGTSIPVDTNAMFERMESFRNTSAEVTADVSGQWLDLGGTLSGVFASIVSGLGRAGDGAESFGDTILQSLGGFMQSFGASLVAMGIGKIALDNFGGPGMIAAGLALTAAGAALSASVSSGPDLTGSGSGSGSVSRGAERFRANTSVQDSNPQLVAVLKGEDLWIVLQNYQQNNRFTRG